MIVDDIGGLFGPIRWYLKLGVIKKRYPNTSLLWLDIYSWWSEISWASKKQMNISHATLEYTFIALATEDKEAKCL